MLTAMSSFRKNRLFIQYLAFAFSYYVVLVLTRRFFFVPGQQMAIFWPVSGIMVAILLLIPFNKWPGYILIAGLLAFLHKMQLGESLVISISHVIIHTIEFTFTAYLIQRFFYASRCIERTRWVGGMIFSCTLGSLLSATLGATMHSVQYAGINYFNEMIFWFLSVYLGQIIIAPLILSIASVWQRRQELFPRRPNHLVMEPLFFTIALILLGCFIVTYNDSFLKIGFLIFPFLLWSAFRYGTMGASITVLLFSVTAFLSLQYSQFYKELAAASLQSEVSTMQFFVMIVAITSLFLVAVRSEREKAQFALADQEERFRLANQAVNDGIWDWFILSGHTFFSDRWLHMLGYQRGDLPENYRAWLHILHPNDKRRAFEQVKKALQTGERFDIKFRLKTKKGRYRWIRCRGRCVSHFQSGQPHRMTGTITDITSRKRAEDALEKSEREKQIILNHISDTITYLDKDLRIVYANRVPITSSENNISNIIGQKCHKVAFSQNEPCARCPAIKCIETKRTVQSEMIAESGESLSISASPVLDSRGNLIGIVECTRDLTEMRTLQQQLIQAQKMEAMGQVAGGVAHDFNNILQIIMGYGELLQMHTSGPDTKLAKYTEQIMASGKRAKALVRQLLTFSRKDTRLDSVLVDVNECIKNFLKMLKRVLGEHIAIEFRPAKELPKVYADLGQLEQIIMNLCVNARDAMPDGGRITISTNMVVVDHEWTKIQPNINPGHYVCFSVTDTGLGMPRDVRDRIFEPFFTTKEIGRGTGLGLAMVYAIIQHHDGFINVYSEPNKGSTFRVYLPVMSEEEPHRAPSDTQIADLYASSGECILLAEDEEEVALFSKMLLEDAGFQVILAKDGEQAVQLFKAHQDKIDLALMDVIMPRLSGQQAATIIRRINPNLPILFCTGYTPETLDENFNGKLVEKPFQKFQLLRKITELLPDKK